MKSGCPTRRVKILQYLANQGTSGAREIAESIGVTRARVLQILQELESANLVERAEVKRRSPQQKYALTGAGADPGHRGPANHTR
jgi:predicted ArsR family transcriptional regulator